MATNQQRLLRELTGSALPGNTPQCWFEPAVVATVTAGAASDGNALVTVTWRGTAVQAAYLAGYTPTVGHTVLLLVQSPLLTIFNRIIGTP